MSLQAKLGELATACLHEEVKANRAYNDCLSRIHHRFLLATVKARIDAGQTRKEICRAEQLENYEFDEIVHELVQPANVEAS